MRILLAAPTRRDPAHRRVLSSLRRELEKAGDSVRLFPPLDESDPRRLRARWISELRRVDALHLHFFSRGFGFLARAPLPAGAPLILTHQGAACRLMQHPEIFERLAARARNVTCVSRQSLRDLLDRFPGLRRKALWIPNGAEPVELQDAPSPALGRPFILSVSRLAAYKGTDVLLMAFARLAERFPKVDLTLCGPDQTGGRIPRFARKLGIQHRIRRLGDVSPRRIASLLRRCHHFVLPSREENMPMALIEAMAAGNACIASDVGGVREAVEHGVSGLLIPASDVGALTRAMERLLEDRELCLRLGRAARRRSRRFTWATVAVRYRRLYSSSNDLPRRFAQEA